MVAPTVNSPPMMMLPGYRCTSGSAWTRTSSGRICRWLADSRACMPREWWLCMIPLGRPVVPELYGRQAVWWSSG